MAPASSLTATQLTSTAADARCASDAGYSWASHNARMPRRRPACTPTQPVRLRGDFGVGRRRVAPQVSVLMLRGNALLANPEWLDVAPCPGMEILPIESSEAWGSGAVYRRRTHRDARRLPAHRARLLESRGLEVHITDLSEQRERQKVGLPASAVLPRPIAPRPQPLTRSVSVRSG